MPDASTTKPAPSTPEATASDVVEPLWKKVLNDRFTILEPIGVGGMGKVYKAIQAPLDRVVAIKVLTPNGGLDPGFRQRFFLEASLTSKLRHPNTVTVIDYGETSDGIFYLAMEYLDGQPLSQVLAQCGPLHWTRCIRIGQQICRSLREAHKLGIVHRDLKPSNVMLLTEDRDQDLVKVLDFGLVKSFLRESDGTDSEITNPGMLLGSPRYMAPEQLRNQADPRTDVYAVGAVLYEMLMGQPLFSAKDTIDVMFKHMNEPPKPMRAARPDIDVPKEVEALVMKCLEKQPAWRFQSMDDVLESMRRAANAAGATGIAGEGGADPSSSQVLPRLETPTPTLPERAPEGTLAIDIDIVPSLRSAASSRLEWLRDIPKPRIAMISVGVAMLIASIAYVSHRRSDSTTELPKSQPAKLATPGAPSGQVEPKADQTSAALNPPAAAKTVAFRISSDPAGARVLLNGRSVGHTPLSVDVQAASDGKANAELVFVLRGYQPLTVTTGGSGPEVVLAQRLQPISSARPVPSEPRRKEPAVAREAAEEPKVVQPAPEPIRKPPSEEEPKKVATVEPAKPKIVATLEAVKPNDIPREAPPAPSPAPNAVLAFREGMTPPQQLQGKPIVYTREALEAGVQGTMRAKCVINLAGALESCRIIQSLPYMDKPVLEALAARRYKPIVWQGKPVAVEYVFDIRLVLQDKGSRCIGSRCESE
jgi:TonB family protein